VHRQRLRVKERLNETLQLTQCFERSRLWLEQFRLFWVVFKLQAFEVFSTWFAASLQEASDAFKFVTMTGPSKMNMLNLRNTAGPGERASSTLERADLGYACQAPKLHNQIGHRLRTIFIAPEEQDLAFESLLKEISERFP